MAGHHGQGKVLLFIYTRGRIAMIETLLLNHIRPTVRDQHGQAFVEYALLLAVVTVGLMFVFQPLGASLQGLLSFITDAF
jgi:Flp pilus assembly pilin Flp